MHARSLRRRARGRPLWFLRILLAGLVATGGAAELAADDPPPRVKVARRKALFIENFTRYIEWPMAALRTDVPFVVCIQGTSDTAAELTKLANARKFKQRSCELRQLATSAADPSTCHVVYIAASEAPQLDRLLAAVAGRPILTVSDTAGFVERGVHINLFEQGRFVAYELNVMAVKRSSGLLKFDHQLLSQGRSIDTTPR